MIHAPWFTFPTAAAVPKWSAVKDAKKILMVDFTHLHLRLFLFCTFFAFIFFQGGGSSLPILQQEMQTMGEIQERFPRFRGRPVYNDEADPLVGWSRPQEWRADVTYAAMAVKVTSNDQASP